MGFEVIMVAEATFWGNTASHWLRGGIAAAAILLLLIGFKALLYRLMLSLARKTHNDIDDLVADLLQRLKYPILTMIAINTGARFLELCIKVKAIFNMLLVLTALLQLALWGNGIIDYIIRRRRQKQLDEESSSTTLSALTSVLPFVIGDFITIDNFRGNVEHIGLKTTRLRSLSGEQLIFSNSDLLSSRISNFKRMQQRRAQFIITVIYQTPLEKLQTIPSLIEEIINNIRETRFERAHFSTFSAASLDFEIVYWVESAEYKTFMDIQQKINLAICHKFAELEIEFAYPTQTLFINNT
ncbi:MAG: hypothetical protein EHM72_14720 [Calditrichaeota bacterium]|nr:MAG: hypothetical protein EHM72_14720 [Calditrichota bacterium]